MEGFHDKLGLVGYWKGEEERKKAKTIKVDALLRTEDSSRVVTETVGTLRWARRSGMDGHHPQSAVVYAYHQHLASILRSTCQKIE